MEIVRYIQPDCWWMTGPVPNKNENSGIWREYPYVICDLCQFEEGGFQKTTCFFGGDHLKALAHMRCDGKACPNLQEVDPGKKFQRHQKSLGRSRGNAKKRLANLIPMRLVEYVTGLNSDRGDGRKIRSVSSEKEIESETYKIGKVAETLRLMNLSAMAEVRVQDQDEEMILGLVPRVLEAFIEPVRGSVVAKEAVEDPKALHYRNLLVEEFKDSSMSGVYPRDPPVRGPFG